MIIKVEKFSSGLHSQYFAQFVAQIAARILASSDAILNGRAEARYRHI
jgi:hypothetical protein